MTFWSFVLLLLIAAVCGAIGQRIAGYSLGGCLISVIVGFIGALLGRWIAMKLELPILLEFQIGTETFPVLWAIVGSTLFTVVIGSLSRREKQK